jgi:hypothetical protein
MGSKYSIVDLKKKLELCKNCVRVVQETLLFMKKKIFWIWFDLEFFFFKKIWLDLELIENDVSQDTHAKLLSQTKFIN